MYGSASDKLNAWLRVGYGSLMLVIVRRDRSRLAMRLLLAFAECLAVRPPTVPDCNHSLYNHALMKIVSLALPVS